MARDVSIHAPVKGATIRMKSLNQQLEVSIHAPVKGATKTTQPVEVPQIVSIHAPVKGATEDGKQSGILIDWFQSTHP